MANSKKADNMKFEEALKELETAVEALERGDLPLDDAIATFQRGTELSRICLEKLELAKASVEKLVLKKEDGKVDEDEYDTEPFAHYPYKEDADELSEENPEEQEEVQNDELEELSFDQLKKMLKGEDAEADSEDDDLKKGNNKNEKVTEDLEQIFGVPGLYDSID